MRDVFGDKVEFRLAPADIFVFGIGFDGAAHVDRILGFGRVGGSNGLFKQEAVRVLQSGPLKDVEVCVGDVRLDESPTKAVI